MTRKTANNSQGYCWFPCEMASEKKQKQKFYTDDTSQLRSGRCSDWLKQISLAAWPIRSTTQIWVSDTSSVWNFCTHFSVACSRRSDSGEHCKVLHHFITFSTLHHSALSERLEQANFSDISGRNQWWSREMSGVSSGYHDWWLTDLFLKRSENSALYCSETYLQLSSQFMACDIH